jgi:acyl-coenzyme A synthetase/AMP-(fatty) acid ligase
VDTWWQTETGGIMISPIAFVTTKPTYFFTITGNQPVLMDENATKLKAIRLPEVYVLNFLGRNCQNHLGRSSAL